MNAVFIYSLSQTLGGGRDVIDRRIRHKCEHGGAHLRIELRLERLQLRRAVLHGVDGRAAPLGGGAATPLARNFWDPRSNQECLPPLYFRDSTPPVTACAHPRG